MAWLISAHSALVELSIQIGEVLRDNAGANCEAKSFDETSEARIFSHWALR